MLRPVLVLACALLASAPLPPVGTLSAHASASASASASAHAVDGGPVSWPDTHLRARPGHPFDVAEADASSPGTGLPTAVPTRVCLPTTGQPLVGPRSGRVCGTVAFHLRERASHPANAPPRRA